MKTDYLSLATVVRLNERFNAGGVLDMAGVEANTYRPQSGAFGQDAFPTIWSKAAVYVHAFASTQYFADGNKRTAWIAANAFLDRNGFELPPVPDIEAETFVQAIAQDVFNTDEERDKSIAKAAEWFETRWASRRPGPCIDPRLEYAFVALEGDAHDGIFDAVGAGTFALAAPSFPFLVSLWVVGRLHWDSSDAKVDSHVFHLELIAAAESDSAAVLQHDATNEATVGASGLRSGHAHHFGGPIPFLFSYQMMPIFLGPFVGCIELSVDGTVIARFPWQMPAPLEVPDALGE